MFDPVHTQNLFKLKMQKRDALTHEIIKYLSGDKYNYLSKGEKQFIDNLVEKRFEIKEYRISNKQLKWLVKIAYRCGFKNNDIEYWREMEQYIQ
jgi:hypothetical protein